MVLDQATNFARGETTSSITSTDTTIDVANASTFADPANGAYNLVLWDQTQYARPTASGASPEIVRVSGRDTTNDTLTVSRGQEGTAAGSYPSGAALIHTQTAKTFGDIDSTFASFWDEQNQEITADINSANGDIDSLSTGDLTGAYPGQIRAIADGRVVQTIDPAETDPIETALEAVDAEGGGRVELPPETTIDHNGPFYARPGSVLVPNGATVNITGDSGGLVVDASQSPNAGNFVFRFNILGELEISGQGPASGQAGHAVHMVDGLASSVWTGRVAISDWDGVAWSEESASASYQNVFSNIHFGNVDAGDEAGLMAMNGSAPNCFGVISAYPTDDGSASDSRVINVSGGTSADISVLNIGGTPNEAVRGLVGDFSVGIINYEPAAQNQTPSSIVFPSSSGIRVGSVRLNSFAGAFDVDSVYRPFSAQPGNYWGAVKVGSDATVNNNIIQLTDDPDAPIITEEPSTSVNNGAGTLSNPVVCLGDLTTVTS